MNRASTSPAPLAWVRERARFAPPGLSCRFPRLAATHDLILPRLMSGELRVRDAQVLAEAVA